jgi:hypothetical protein
MQAAVGVSLLMPSLTKGEGPVAPTETGGEFFEKQVRPILADNCYSCHSATAEKLKGGLRLDDADALMKGGDSGPVVVPGDPDRSLLIKAIRYTDDDLRMPPKNKKLSTAQIDTLEQWVKAGAPFPAIAPNRKPGTGTASHWAFKPVRMPPIPSVKKADWIQEELDAFILAKLEAKSLAPSPKADKRALIRRASFDLTGLPPSPEEVNAFVTDCSPDAFGRVVERLLASPQYGERWARYWLDIARYADTKGYVFEEERRYPFAYTYRDYVISAFNGDLPFDQFLIQQIAADQLPLGEGKRPLAALGFLTLGRRFLNNPHDIIDDRIDVVTRGTMALTVACARCHDHKYDPITTRDYYSLYGVFASCSEPEEEPLLGNKAVPDQYRDYLKAHQERLDELNHFRETKAAEARTRLRRLAGKYLLTAHDAAEVGDHSKAEALARQRQLDPGIVRQWVEKLTAWRAAPAHAVFAPWFALAECAESNWADDVPRLLAEVLDSTPGLNPLVRQAFSESVPMTLAEASDRYGRLFAGVDALWEATLMEANRAPTQGLSVATPTSLPDPALEELRQLLYSSDSPAIIAESDVTRLFDIPSIQKVRALKRKVEELDATHPGAPPRAMALQDNPTPTTPHVLIRGNPANPGPEVPRQFIRLLAGPEAPPFKKGSGRLELAEAIASTNNPLTARVLVNRVWLHYFGAGLVRTPSDFGMRSDPPSHPELLDYLAARFMAEGWSLKKLHRWIVLSSTYQQASDDNAAGLRADPGNQLLWKMNRRRLDFEATRDSILAVTGSLDLTAGGHPIDIVNEPSVPRRTIYGFVERQNLPGLFRTFDFASPDATSPQRFSTTVPQQALYMLNSPFAARMAGALIRHVDSCDCSRERVEALYKAVYQREPTHAEMQLAVDFLNAQPKVPSFSPEPVSWAYGYGTYDPTLHRLKAFHPLPHFTGAAWQGGTNLPDPNLGWAQLKAKGGHPGNDHDHAVVRRWQAPYDMVVTVTGTLSHESDKGDGVQAWVSSSRVGELGTWTVQKRKQETIFERLEVKAGETLEFIVDCRADPDSDSFEWTPAVRALDAASQASGSVVNEWDAQQDFSGPKEPARPLTAWERYAQVLLMSNEFVFED